MADVHMVIVSISDEDFGVDISQVKEIIKPIETFKVPTAPDYFEGLINLRGKVHSIFNLRKKIDLPYRQFDDDTRFIIADKTSEPVGFIVDKVKGIATGKEESLENMPLTFLDPIKKYVSGTAKTNDRQIFLLDINEVLSTTATAPQ
jgi:purine-binding chemotaxis protein CheW